MPAKPVDITVVVVTYNREAWLRQALYSLLNQATHGKFSYEILVIDDGSTDATAAAVRAVAAQAGSLPVRYVYKEGGGEGDARNWGVAEAQGRWIGFCDDDQVANPRWLSELYKAALAQGAQCVGGSVALLAPEAELLKLGPKARRFLGEKWLSSRLRPHEAKYHLGAGNLLVQRSVFEEVGGFDITLRQGVDTDFFWRVEQAGFAFGTAPGALVYHVLSASRLQPEHLRRVCLRKGVATQRLEAKYAGPVKTGLDLLRRLGIVLVLDLLLLLMATLGRDTALAIDSRCGLWYKIGFIRAGLFSMAPSIFRQAEFFRDMDVGYHGANRQGEFKENSHK